MVLVEDHALGILVAKSEEDRDALAFLVVLRSRVGVIPTKDNQRT